MSDAVVPFPSARVLPFPVARRVNFTTGDIVALPDGRIGSIQRINRLFDGETGRIELEDAEVAVEGLRVACPLRQLANPVRG